MPAGDRVRGHDSMSQMSRAISALFPGLRTEAQLQNVRTEVTEAQVKLIQQESSLKELSERGEGRTSPRPLISHRASHPTLDSHPDPSVTQTLFCDPDLLTPIVPPHPDPDPWTLPFTTTL